MILTRVSLSFLNIFFFLFKLNAELYGRLMSDINEIPASFDKNLLEKALLEYTRDPTLELIDYKVRENLGDIAYHFSSILFKVDLEYKRVGEDIVYQIHAIVKTLPDVTEQSHNTHLNYVKETTQFDTELKVYEKILPKMDLMLYAMGLEHLAPRQIYQTNDGPVPILIMENMISLGYSTIYDRALISFDAAKVLIGKLAQFHATSFVLDKQRDETVAQLNGVYFDFHMDKSYCNDLDRSIETMKKLNGFEKIVERLQGTSEKMFETVRGVYYSPEDAACKVLCHGDMKSANTLIRSYDNNIQNGVFVDFAYTNFHTPAIDLFEFLYKVPALDAIVYKEQRDNLVDYYMETFRSVLTKMSIERIDETIEDIKSEMDRCNALQIWFVMFLVVYKLEICNDDTYAAQEVLIYEEYWLKTVLDELLDL